MSERALRIELTDERVPVEPAIVTRFLWRAERVRRREAMCTAVPFYRWEIVHEDGRWKVVAMQNRLVPW